MTNGSPFVLVISITYQSGAGGPPKLYKLQMIRSVG